MRTFLTSSSRLSAVVRAGAGAMAVALLVSGCSSASKKEDNLQESNAQYLQPVGQEVDPIAPMTLRVVGYGAPDSVAKGRSEAQLRLLAIRSSKMDAYRAMAERVYGMSVSGSTTVRDMVVQNDRFRSYVETYMHGARVVSADVMADGTVETVLEMVIDSGFRNCLQTTDGHRFNVDCRASAGAQKSAGNFGSSQRQRVQAESSMPESGFYFIE